MESYIEERDSSEDYGYDDEEETKTGIIPNLCQSFHIGFDDYNDGKVVIVSNLKLSG